MSPDALARSVVEVLPDDAPLVLAGHSASCQVVARIAAEAGDRVAGLVLVGPTTDPAARTWPALMRRWLRTARREDPRQVPGLLRQYARTGPVSMARGMNAARDDRLEHTLDGLACPVLVIRGRHDAICDESWARTAADRAPSGSRAVTLPAGAHMVPSTRGALVAAEIAAFLRELD
jgi:pimeloyl-ACP methyl ester carboxylesterase